MGVLYYCRIFSQITWFPYPLKRMGPWIIPSSYRYHQFMVQFHPSSSHQEAFVRCKDLFPIFLHSLQTFLKSSSCPEIHGHLHVKELSRKSWKKSYFILRRSGLYFSNKGTSKVRRNKHFFLKKIVNQKRCRQTDDSFILISIYPVNIQAGAIYDLTGKS